MYLRKHLADVKDKTSETKKKLVHNGIEQAGFLRTESEIALAEAEIY